MNQAEAEQVALSEKADEVSSHLESAQEEQEKLQDILRRTEGE
jgi:hypothetical protein